MYLQGTMQCEAALLFDLIKLGIVNGDICSKFAGYMKLRSRMELENDNKYLPENKPRR